VHRSKYAATDHGGSLRVSGRYHRAFDLYPAEQTFAALYTSLEPETCLGELIRHITPDLLPHLNGFRLSELSAQLSRVVDCRDPKRLGLQIEDLTGDATLDRSREIGAAA
jgi:hypothetical protein